MTIEEKANAYDKALYKAKELIRKMNTYGFKCIEEDIEDLFSCSVESEDERTRKALINYFKSYDTLVGENWNGIECDDVIAYLEKQKYNRMQPVYDNQESFESALDKAWKSYNESGARTVDSCEDDYTECAHAKGFREGYLFGLEKQKENKFIPRVLPCSAAWFEDCDENQREQKPAEWSEEDEKIISTIISLLGQYIDYKSVSGNSSGYAAPRYGREIDWLKSLRPQPKQEWSEEDERIIDTIVSVLGQYIDYKIVSGTGSGYATPRYNKEIAWLKSLPLDLKKKNEDVAKLCSNEWNEEDEKMKENLLYLMLENNSQDSWEGTYEWLKSFRPQYHGDVTMTEAYKMGLEVGKASSWKPSEHQMKILKAVKEYVGRGSGYWGEALGSLIEDLEKLM